ncbi:MULTISPECIES: glucarate dehydratase family protein [unclassified Crossiella]|uniref:glucarate dehydratase family protein n=1 Tax=unclassified Crossiella TaxID=2620835 RepID=UPI001FFEA308|nr:MULTISPECIES: glucarate dehydratase family protein [unclassified Crossiella]MCK2240381.1 glucarate dehydratase family protein [Crossiella sp. S99.2]MCK2253167.1 glucarate dehydratase family protein [Crossiella sp. S99.1]
MSTGTRIQRITITPIAFRDPPLLNSAGVHEPWALRSIIEVVTEDGVLGLGESYGDTGHLARMESVVPGLIGLDVYALNQIHAKVAEALGGVAGSDKHGLTGDFTSGGTVDRVFSPFEVACLDIQGHLLGRPVHDLLGGKVRDTVPYSAYLFYKWAGHPGAEADEWGEAIDPAGMVEQTRKMVREYGFGSIKLKGGVFPPEQEIAAIHALREAFPSHPLRIDPNCAWSVPTSLRVAKELDGVLEYLEDPTPGINGMSEVAKQASMPLATNMCVVSYDQLPEAIAKDAVQVILSDHHYWGGLTRSRHLGVICDTFGIGLSMHSNSHLGISLAAMTHLAAATPNLSYACDTHYPWNAKDEVIEPGVVSFVDGAMAVPTTPGLGVTLDRDQLARLHENYRTCGLKVRDDTGYMQKFQPDYERKRPRW